MKGFKLLLLLFLAAATANAGDPDVYIIYLGSPNNQSADVGSDGNYYSKYSDGYPSGVTKTGSVAFEEGHSYLMAEDNATGRTPGDYYYCGANSSSSGDVVYLCENICTSGSSDGSEAETYQFGSTTFTEKNNSCDIYYNRASLNISNGDFLTDEQANTYIASGWVQNDASATIVEAIAGKFSQIDDGTAGVLAYGLDPQDLALGSDREVKATLVSDGQHSLEIVLDDESKQNIGNLNVYDKTLAAAMNAVDAATGDHTEALCADEASCEAIIIPEENIANKIQKAYLTSKSSQSVRKLVVEQVVPMTISAYTGPAGKVKIDQVNDHLGDGATILNQSATVDVVPGTSGEPISPVFAFDFDLESLLVQASFDPNATEGLQRSAVDANQRSYTISFIPGGLSN